MANIVFEKKSSAYEAVVKLTDAGALHIERAGAGDFHVEQTHIQGGRFAEVESDAFNNMENKSVIDFTITDDVYPVWLRLVSSSAVTSASGTDAVSQVTA